MAPPHTPEETEPVTMPEQPAPAEQTPETPEVPESQVETTPKPSATPTEMEPTVPDMSAEVSGNPAIPTELVEQVQELVNEAFTKGPREATGKAERSGNPALVDALHAALSQEDVKKALKDSGKLSPAP